MIDQAMRDPRRFNLRAAARDGPRPPGPFFTEEPMGARQRVIAVVASEIKRFTAARRGGTIISRVLFLSSVADLVEYADE
jgi:hypothetical protein